MPTRTRPRRTQPQRRDSPWLRRRTEPGWLLLPLRAFLGLTYTYAGLQKLANPDFLDPKSPTSVANQMALLRHTSPIGPLLTISTHAPTFVGLTIAFAELAVGVGTLLGLFTRIAAVGGALLALTFFLTVSWSTTPYYYGADIVFVFAWSVMIAFGAGGVLSVDAWLRNQARRGLGLGPEPATLAVGVAQLRSLCARGAKCGLMTDGSCTRLAGCPVFPVTEQLPAAKRDELSRRTVVAGGVAAGVVGLLTLALGGLTAAIGRATGGTKRHVSAAAALTGAATSAAPASTDSSTGPSTSSSATEPGTEIATVSSIGVGQAHSFTNPADDGPAWLVHTSGSTFVAFSAVCTHAGCPVQFDSSTTEFICPCHGGTYDAKTGKVLGGPPPAPLPSIPVQVVNGQVRVG